MQTESTRHSQAKSYPLVSSPAEHARGTGEVEDVPPEKDIEVSVEVIQVMEVKKLPGGMAGERDENEAPRVGKRVMDT
jgi:hypothetical protein